jgi:hypothetical protein
LVKTFEEAKQVASNLGIDPELKRGSRIRKKKRFFDYTGDADYSFTFESPDVHFKIQVIFPTMELLLSELRGLSEGTAEVSKLLSLFCVRQMTWMNLPQKIMLKHWKRHILKTPRQ